MDPQLKKNYKMDKKLNARATFVFQQEFRKFVTDLCADKHERPAFVTKNYKCIHRTTSLTTTFLIQNGRSEIQFQ